MFLTFLGAIVGNFEVSSIQVPIQHGGIGELRSQFGTGRSGSN